MFSNLFNALVRWWYNELTAEQALKKVEDDFWDKNQSRKYILRHDELMCVIKDMVITQVELKKLKKLCRAHKIEITVPSHWKEGRSADFYFVKKIR